MRIAITGATGFVGRAALDAALGRGHDVTRIVRPGLGRDALGGAAVEADLADTSALARVAATVDAVVHCAASDDPAFLPVTRAAADALIDGLPEGGAFAMHAGSLVFGDTGADVVAEPAFAPPPFLEGRAAFDRAVLARGTDRSRRCFVVYGSFVYGGAGAAIPAAMIRVAEAAGAVLCFDGGDQAWSTVHVDDFGALLIDAVQNGPTGGHALFAAGRTVQIRDAADIVATAMGVAVRQVADDTEAALYGPFGPALRMNQHFSSAATRGLCGWDPMTSDAEDALAVHLADQVTHAAL